MLPHSRAFFRTCQSLPDLQSLPFILPFKLYFPTSPAGCKVGAPFNVNALHTQPYTVDLFPHTAKTHSKTAKTQIKAAAR